MPAHNCVHSHREQLTAIYFLKVWLYSWLWIELLDLFLVHIPAIAFLTVRTTVTTLLGVWFVGLSRPRTT